MPLDSREFYKKLNEITENYHPMSKDKKQLIEANIFSALGKHMTKGSRSFEKFSKMSNEAKETLYWFIFNKKPEDNNILTNADVMSKTLSVAAKGNIKDVNNNKKQRCVFDSNDNITINGDVELDDFPYEELPAIGVVEIKGSLVIKNSSFISFKNK